MTTSSGLPDFQLRRLGEARPAGIHQCSLPWPRELGGERQLSLGGVAGAAIPLGRWPGMGEEKRPRRMLISADGGAAGKLSGAVGVSEPGELSGGGCDIRVYEHPFMVSPDPFMVWYRNQLVLESGGKRLGMAMGLRWRDGSLSWWEFTKLLKRDEDEFQVTYEMGGTIPFVYNHRDPFKGPANPFMHKHNWLNGFLTLRVYKNGVVEIFARHSNSRFVDTGKDCEDGVPVIGFFSEELEGEWVGDQPWTGDREEVTIAGIPFHLGDAAPLATPEAPGRWERHPGVLVWQPYQGGELYGGKSAVERTGTNYIVHSREQKFLRGMSRTLHFSLSFSDRSPRIARYLAPYWWYGVNGELSGRSFVPVTGVLRDWESDAEKWLELGMKRGGFEHGNLPRTVDLENDPGLNEDGRRQQGWEGEIPEAYLLFAYRCGEESVYEDALAASWYFHDVIIDHADKSVRSGGHQPPAVSLTMLRPLCLVGLYLETGYHHPLETAEAVIQNGWWVHRNSWPRFAIGRDATFARAAMMLYRFTGKEVYREIGRMMCEDIGKVQLPHGPFGDQGGGACLHGWPGFVVKPWMGAMATNVVLDYLELFPDGNPEFWEIIKRYVDWLMSERRDPGDGKGRAWFYQHEYADTRVHYENSFPAPLLLPRNPWHHENLGRLLWMASDHFGDPEYFAAWAESHFRPRARGGLDQSVCAAMQFLPLTESRLVEVEAGGAQKPPRVAMHLPEGFPWGKTVRFETATGRWELDTQTGVVGSVKE